MIRSLLAALVLSVSFFIWPPIAARAGEWHPGDVALIGGGCGTLEAAQLVMSEWELRGEETASARWAEYEAVGRCGRLRVRVGAELVQPHDRYRLISEGQYLSAMIWEAVLNGTPIFFALVIDAGPHKKPLEA